MKKRLLLSAGLISLLFVSCSIEEDMNLQNEIEPISNSAQNSNSSSVPIPDIVQNQMVIQFKNNLLTEEDKVLIRNKYQNKYKFFIQGIETCDCNKDGLELWTIDTTTPGFLGVEDLVKNLSESTGDDDMEGDYQFSFHIKEGTIIGNPAFSIKDKVVIENSKEAVNIAILDTGVDYDYFEGRFLYNSSNTEGCDTEISGWDFVNHDNDPRDDNGHGSFVGKIISDVLNKSGIEHSILAVKAFDSNGRGTYFDVGCALQYIIKKPGNFIVNTSFGYYGITNQQILENIIESANERILVVSSAGNEGVNTDSFGNEHFPSSYDSLNLLTVGGYIQGIDMAVGIDDRGYVRGLFKDTNSNYGYTSIDVLAPFSGYNLRLESPHSIIKAKPEGTSFANALTSARAALLSQENSGVPILIKNAVISSGYRSQALIGFIKNQRIIVKDMFNQGGTGPVLNTP